MGEKRSANCAVCAFVEVLQHYPACSLVNVVNKFVQVDQGNGIDILRVHLINKRKGRPGNQCQIAIFSVD